MTPARIGSALLALAVLLGVPCSAPQRTRPRVPHDASATVTVHGADGTFGALGDAVPSGQSLTRRTVPGWGLPAGVQAGRVALAADGTVFVAGTDQGGPDRVPSAGDLVVGTYQPASARYDTVRLRTDAGRPEAYGPRGEPAGGSVQDLEPLADGTAMAFTARRSLAGQNPADAGAWPVLGVLSRVDGRWQVAAGNQWTGAALAATGAGTGERLCPPDATRPAHSDCGGLGEMATLPRSGHVILAQGAGTPAVTGSGLAAIAVSGPDGGGRFTVSVTAHLPYPMIEDPGTDDPGDHLRLSPRGIRVDPTGRPGDERFAVSFEVVSTVNGWQPGVLQEFSYDAATGTIRPVSAPVVPGDLTGTAFYGFGAALYDSRGNLWVSRHHGLQGGSLAVFARDGERRPGLDACRLDPGRSPGSYRSTAPGSRPVWGRGCRPDYDILQGRRLLGLVGLVEDPARRDVVALTLTGVLLPVRAAGSGRELTFRVGNLVDLGRKLLPTAADHGGDIWPGAVSAGRELWLAAYQGLAGRAGSRAAQWLYSVRLDDLFEPAPVAVSAVPGRATVVQAERTRTGSTTQRRGAAAAVDVDSDAYFAPCSDWPQTTGCGYDGLPGNDFVLVDDTGYGHLRGAVEYAIRVERAGGYRVAFRVSTFENVPNAVIELEAAGRRYPTPVRTGGRWLVVPVNGTVDLPAGVHTVRLHPPPGGGGWSLSWFTLQPA